MNKTARQVLSELGFEEAVLSQWSDKECAEQYEAIQMYPEE